MQDTEQSEYFHRRAEEEREAAKSAADERAAQPHRELAQRYDAMAKGDAASEEEGEDEPRGATVSKDFTILP